MYIASLSELQIFANNFVKDYDFIRILLTVFELILCGHSLADPGFLLWPTYLHTNVP